MTVQTRPLESGMGGDDLEDGLELDPGLVASSDAEPESSEDGPEDDGGDLDNYWDDDDETRLREEMGIPKRKEGSVDDGGDLDDLWTDEYEKGFREANGLRKRKAVSDLRLDEAAGKEDQKRRRKAKEKERKAKVSRLVIAFILVLEYATC